MRFQIPAVGAPAAVRFPEVHRRTLANGLRVWAVEHTGVPVVSVAFVVEAGTATDPHDLPGLASLTSAVLTEGAGAYDTIALADALARIGAQISTETATDTSAVTLTTLSKHFDRALALLADVVRRPRLAEADFARVRDLRLSRLKQMARTPAAAADRALLSAVYGRHPYGHGALGTTHAIERVSLADVRACWSRTWHPSRGALMVAGDLAPAAALAACEAAFGDWPSATDSPGPLDVPRFEPSRAIGLVHWPDAPQAEIRVGHGGPARVTEDYHALVALNAVLGGQFTSRINRNLREERAITYGARSSFEMRRAGGLFSCDAGVQADATAVALAEVLREMRDIQAPDAIAPEELDRARASLVRGYGRYFETAGQLVRAMSELTTYGLPDDTFDGFVPGIEALTPEVVSDVGRRFLRPDDAALIVVGDREKLLSSLESLGRKVVDVQPEF